jgi:RNA 3'-terminal phosphate cyclase (ATP)
MVCLTVASAISLVGVTSTGCLLGGDKLGKRGMPSQEVGKGAADSLISNLRCDACVDEYLQDQLIVFMALGRWGLETSTGFISVLSTLIG